MREEVEENEKYLLQPFGKAHVFKKSYGDITLTVILELPRISFEKTHRQNAVNVLKDEIYNLLNDSELGKLLTPTKGGN